MIILTGGAGFIGSNVLKELNNRNYTDILIVEEDLYTKDDKDPEKIKNLYGKLFTNIEYCYEVYLDKFEPIRNVEAVIHCGANSSTTASFIEALESNLQFSNRILQYCLVKDIPLIYLSSAATYGRQGIFKDGIENLHLCQPENNYALCKHAFDLSVKHTLETKEGLPKIVGVKPFNVYGPGESHKEKMSSLIYRWTTALLNGNKIELFVGSDKFSRDFVHVDDISRVVVDIFENEIESNIYNAGSGWSANIELLAQSVIRYVKGKKSDVTDWITYIKPEKEARGRYQEHTKSDNRRLSEQGIIPPTRLVEVNLESYIDWITENTEIKKISKEVVYASEM